MVRTIAWVIAILVLLSSGALGLYNGVTEWAEAGTGWQQSVTGGVFTYGALGIVAGIGLIMRRRWSYPLSITWGVVATYVSSAAVLAYGGPDASISGALGAGAGSALIAFLVAAAARAATRPRALPQSGTAP